MASPESWIRKIGSGSTVTCVTRWRQINSRLQVDVPGVDVHAVMTDVTGAEVAGFSAVAGQPDSPYQGQRLLYRCSVVVFSSKPGAATGMTILQPPFVWAGPILDQTPGSRYRGFPGFRAGTPVSSW